MSSVLGIDLSTFEIHFCALPEDTNDAVFHRTTMYGPDARRRLRSLPDNWPHSSYLEDCYLAAIEIPYGRGQSGTLAKLNRVFGAISVLLPAGLEVWEVGPHEWKKELGLTAKPTEDDIRRLFDDPQAQLPVQDARDAACIALYARQVNRRAVEAA